ncbi:carbon-nitrogen hydrolase family protein [Mycolicibacterium frederiksbergense]|uniref:carbon-nitrogen hydrolase family protein n=1 Tax=Mycolicibacterium frederiksbergense TaxID=117567 RepID=UPI00265BBFD2|nr:carbon-nitrogen hydrolase family protein [Mycolicibacterium frederiksbergense]MBX9921369.1 carbon-nitrogen hydrolase family protein [Mycolicibacterium frederiksbergense]MDO0973057.1 carbon-nitrogen hydrolase family protein [Mycolicibacterium frederiksbergense]
MRIALAQIRSGTDPEANLELVDRYSRQAADAGATLVLFPEATMCRFGVPLAPVAEPLDGRWADGVRAVAQRTGITVVAGMFCPSGDGRVTNTLIASGPGTDAHYDKIHLYDAFGFAESKTVAPGAQPTVIDVGGVRVGLTLCYDVRFPELYTDLADRGAHLITVHASWGTGPGKLDQWTLLARARAIDTTAVVAAVDQAYPGDEIAALGPTGVGGSLVASATGDVIAAADADEQLLVTDIDLDAAATARERIAVLRNRTHFAKADPGRDGVEAR